MSHEKISLFIVYFTYLQEHLNYVDAISIDKNQILKLSQKDIDFKFYSCTQSSFNHFPF